MAIYWFLTMLTTVSIACNAHTSDPFILEDDQLSEEGKENIPDYAGAQVLKIKRSPELIALAHKNEFNLWSGNATHVDVMVLKKNVNMFKSVLSRNLIPYEVMIQDVDGLIKTHLHAIKLKYISAEKKDHGMTWTSFHRLEIIHEYMDYLAAKYPSTVTVGTMGQTKERRPLKYCKVSPPGDNTNTTNAVFIEGGIHAREWISPSAVTYILKTLAEDLQQLPDSLRKLEYYILPVLNPDGYVHSFTTDRLWRKNRSGYGTCLGTDLNRNFNFNWAGKGSSNNPCSEIYRGRTASSEEETKALSKFILDLKGKLSAYITFHSYGQLILIPFGFDYNELPSDYKELQRVGDLAKQRIYEVGGAEYEVGNTAYALYPASGGSDDWAKGAANVKYCYTIELRDRGQYSFLLPPQEIIPAATDALEAFKVIASAVSNLSNTYIF